jgi:anthranilate phosphoribosyltransferase
VVHGSDGLDEITITGPTHVAELRQGRVSTYEVTPEEFGITRAPLESLNGGDARANAEIIEKILAGEQSAKRDVVVLNAAAALVAAGRADTIKDAITITAKSLDSAAAREKLKALIRFTQSS